jgi:hypothetical protein
MLSMRDDAWAANIVHSHKEWAGIPYPSVRKVGPTMRPFGRNLSWIKMVGIQVDNWRLIPTTTRAHDVRVLARPSARPAAAIAA